MTPVYVNWVPRGLYKSQSPESTEACDALTHLIDRCAGDAPVGDHVYERRCLREDEHVVGAARVVLLETEAPEDGKCGKMSAHLPKYNYMDSCSIVCAGQEQVICFRRIYRTVSQYSGQLCNATYRLNARAGGRKWGCTRRPKYRPEKRVARTRNNTSRQRTHCTVFVASSTDTVSHPSVRYTLSSSSQ